MCIITFNCRCAGLPIEYNATRVRVLALCPGEVDTSLNFTKDLRLRQEALDYTTKNLIESGR